jgi:hypothetical protein
MEEKLEISKKKKLFFVYRMPITFLVMFILIYIVQFIIAIILCSILPHRTELRMGEISLAICQEILPTLTYTLIILILLGITITILKLIKDYKNIESVQLSNLNYLAKLIVGCLFWLILLYILFWLIILLLSLLL